MRAVHFHHPCPRGAGAAILLLALLTAAGAAAETPEQVARDYFHALRDAGFGAIVEFLHPDALAEFKATMVPLYAVSIDQGDMSLLVATFGPDATLQQVEDSTPREFMAKFMNLLAGQLDGKSIQFDSIEVIGTVEERVDLVHVLCRIQVGVDEIAVKKMEVVSMVPEGRTWRLQLTGELEGIARALQQQLQ